MLSQFAKIKQAAPERCEKGQAYFTLSASSAEEEATWLWTASNPARCPPRLLFKKKEKKIPLSLIIDWQPIIDVKCHFEGTTCYCILYEYVDLRSNCSTTKPTQSPDLQHPQPMK